MYFYVSDHVAVAFINKVAKLTMQAKKLFEVNRSLTV